MAYESLPSNIVSLTPRAAPPANPNPQPVVLSGVAGDGNCRVIWEATAGATGYNVYRATGAGAFALLATVAVGTINYFDTGAAGSNLPAPVNGTTYRYQVTALGN